MINAKKRKPGFTLIELLVVIIIIGIIATIVLISLQSVRMKARDSRRVSDIRQLMLAFELYYDDHLEYPGKGIIGVVAKPPDRLPPYLDETPEDPGNIVLACQPEGYRWWGNYDYTQKYCLWACLENGTFFAASPKGTKVLSIPPDSLSDCW